MTEVAQNEPVEPTPQVEVEAVDQVNEQVETSEPLEGSTDETPNEDNAHAEEEKPVGRRDKRINQLTFEKHELERQKNAEIEELKRKLDAQTAPQTVQVSENKPTRAQFDYDEDAYIEAVADWRAEQKVKAYVETQSKQQQQLAEQQAVTVWNEKRSGYAAEHPEYLELTQQRGQAITSKAVAEFITASEVGPRLHHELLDNFAELQRIQTLPDVMVGAALAKLEAELTKVKPKQKSTAPKPVEPVTSTKSSVSNSSRTMPTNW